MEKRIELPMFVKEESKSVEREVSVSITIKISDPRTTIAHLSTFYALYEGMGDDMKSRISRLIAEMHISSTKGEEVIVKTHELKVVLKEIYRVVKYVKECETDEKLFTVRDHDYSIIADIYFALCDLLYVE